MQIDRLHHSVVPYRHYGVIAHRIQKSHHYTTTLQVGMIEQLVFPDQTFDVVLSTFRMHHLPDDLKRQGLAEIARVLKPGGACSFSISEAPLAWHSRIQDQPRFLKEVGFSPIETGKLRFPGLGFVRAQKSSTEEGKATV